MIEGVTVQIDGEAVVVASASPLRLLSSTVRRGGLAEARAVINHRHALDEAISGWQERNP